MTTRLTVLESGLRVVTCEMPHSETAAAALWTGTGARHEPAALNGISHFIEHMLFKGTARRSARRIMEEIEGVGGDLNAFTSEEHTCYHGAAAAEFFPRLCDVLGDMFLNSRFAPADIERERGVIAEEIQMYHDEPASRVLELLNRLYWGGHALGLPITGTLETIQGLGREQLVGYLRERCHAGNTVFVAAGRLNHEEVAGRVARQFAGFSAKPEVFPEPAPRPPRSLRVVCERREVQQTQVAVGFSAPGSHDPARFAMHLLSVLLAGNASSRLFQQLRERRGLCYSVGSHLSQFAEAGLLTVQLGLEAENVPRSLELIRKEIEQLAVRPPAPAELRRAREYAIGTSRMSLERASSQTMRAGGSLLVYGRVVDPGETYESLRAVTPEEISQVAREHLRPRAVAVVGPAPREDAVRSALESPGRVSRARPARKG